jgi:hypothetical protein
MRTLFETLLSTMLNNRSANPILHYIENKGWFSEYRNTTNGEYMSIPYQKWIETTLINLKHIKIINEFIHEGKGSIRYEDGYVKIWASNDKPFKSLSPRHHIYNICRKKQSTYTLVKYLDEFYYSDFYNFRKDDSAVAYQIPYVYWYDYFQLSTQHIRELNSYLKFGCIRVLYTGDSKSTPSKVEIRI